MPTDFACQSEDPRIVIFGETLSEVLSVTDVYAKHPKLTQRVPVYQPYKTHWPHPNQTAMDTAMVG